VAKLQVIYHSCIKHYILVFCIPQNVDIHVEPLRTQETMSVISYCRAYSVATIIRRGIGLTTGFIESHTVTHNYSVYAL
jgi:hypothetical protein